MYEEYGVPIREPHGGGVPIREPHGSAMYGVPIGEPRGGGVPLRQPQWATFEEAQGRTTEPAPSKEAQVGERRGAMILKAQDTSDREQHHKAKRPHTSSPDEPHHVAHTFSATPSSLDAGTDPPLSTDRRLQLFSPTEAASRIAADTTGKLVRRAGAVRLLTDRQVERQFALRGKAAPQGRKADRADALRAIVGAEVDAREAKSGAEGVTTDDEIERLKGMGFGPVSKPGRKAAAACDKAPRVKKKDVDWRRDSSSSSGCDEDSGVEESRLGESDVYRVERILNAREGANGLEYLIKWEGWSSRWNDWEPEEYMLDKRMVRRFWRKRNQQNGGEELRVRSKRSGALASANRARDAANADESSDGDAGSASE